MGMSLLVLVCGAALFYRAAEYEGMSPLAWGTASIALTAIIGMGLHGGIGLMVLAQVALFIVMWWYNAFRKKA